MGIITTQVVINAIKDSSKIHAEDITKVMDTANVVGEAVDVPEEVSICTDMAGVILEVRLTINTNNIMLMMIMIKLLSNMVVHALYVADKHCYKVEHDINDIMEKMSINTHQAQQSGLY